MAVEQNLLPFYPDFPKADAFGEFIIAEADDYLIEPGRLR
jgi:hypothetical protein